jgi:hypothetical protein
LDKIGSIVTVYSSIKKQWMSQSCSLVKRMFAVK